VYNLIIIIIIITININSIIIISSRSSIVFAHSPTSSISVRKKTDKEKILVTTAMGSYL